ncbi:MAG: glutathione S-transferase [Kordiimonadaceae bacterium]|nr:glutathione S-transferase [Kordiimonadaceae bacterium]
MIKVHHLNNSRSQRVSWMLEELELGYEIIQYERDAETSLAPESLKKIHPLGKSPVLEDAETLIAESGATIDYLARTYSAGGLCPTVTDADYERYNELMHYSEGSAMLPLILALYVRRLGDAGEPLAPRITSEIELHIGYLAATLGANDYFMGEKFSAVDVQMTFVLEAANVGGGLAKIPNLASYLERVQTRPAYLRAIERGGVYFLGPKPDDTV